MLTDRGRLGAESGNIFKAFETLAYFDFVKQSRRAFHAINTINSRRLPVH